MSRDESLTTITDADGWGPGRQAARGEPFPALVVAWSAAEPARLGEVALIADIGAEHLLGRGPRRQDDPALRLVFARQRPGSLVVTDPLGARGISRDQLRVAPCDGGLQLRRTGRCRLRVNGVAVQEAVAHVGDVVELVNQLVLYVTRRPLQLPALRSYPSAELHAFGGPDPDGMVGESAALWQVRDQLAFAAQSEAHALVLGATGVGKELAARALHRLSSRGQRPLVSRNAATFPPGLIDAELFGNAEGYPNPGMRERPGLIGEASGSTLFLDEIGELPPDLCSHLLRVLDGQGEYQRLGESRVRASDLRLVGATNRRLEALRADFVARFTLRVELPGLDARREDIPLLVRHLLRDAARSHPALSGRFFAGSEPRVDPRLVARLLRNGHAANIRDLSGLLWRAMSTSAADFVALTPEVAAELDAPPEREEPTPPPAGSDELDGAAIRVALERCGGSVTAAARVLGLKNRFVLYRLMKKHGM